MTFLNQKNRQNDLRTYFTINLNKRMCQNRVSNPLPLNYQSEMHPTELPYPALNFYLHCIIRAFAVWSVMWMDRFSGLAASLDNRCLLKMVKKCSQGSKFFPFDKRHPFLKVISVQESKQKFKKSCLPVNP